MDNKSLVDKLLEAAKQVHKSSVRGSSNYVVVGSDTADMIQDIFYKNRAENRINKIKKVFKK